MSMKITKKNFKNFPAKGSNTGKSNSRRGPHLQQPGEQQPQLDIATLDHERSEPISLDILLSDVVNYKADNISQYLHNWCEITIERVILDIVQNGLKEAEKSALL